MAQRHQMVGARLSPRGRATAYRRDRCAADNGLEAGSRLSASANSSRQSSHLWPRGDELLINYHGPVSSLSSLSCVPLLLAGMAVVS